MTEYYSVIQYNRPDRAPVYIVDGPDVCPHCLAQRVPLINEEGSAQTGLTPSSVMIDTPSALKLRFAADWPKIEEGMAQRAQLLEAMRAKLVEAMNTELLTVRPELLN